MTNGNRTSLGLLQGPGQNRTAVRGFADRSLIHSGTGPGAYLVISGVPERFSVFPANRRFLGFMGLVPVFHTEAFCNGSTPESGPGS